LDALTRLLRRLHISRNEPELYAGLSHVCRYSGLLEASVAAHLQARRLDPHIATSIEHTYIMLGDYQTVLDSAMDSFLFGKPFALAMLGRKDEALKMVSDNEPPANITIARLYMGSFRKLLEGDAAGCMGMMEELLTTTFRDPEGVYYMARQFGYFQEKERAMNTLSRAIDLGFFCYPAMVRDPWFDCLRDIARFNEILAKARTQHQRALDAFSAEGGESLLGRAGVSAC